MLQKGMKNTYRPRRNFEALKSRRIRAGKMFVAGHAQAEVARALKVSPVSVHRWHVQWKQGGVKNLLGAGRAGRKPRLNGGQIKKIDRILRQGPRHHGFATELWTLPRMASVIEKKTGIRYHPGHVWKILGHLNWSLQRPAKRARQRDEEAIRQWIRKTWPAIKKKPEGLKPGFSSRMNLGFRRSLPSEGLGPPGDKPPC